MVAPGYGYGIVAMAGHNLKNWHGTIL